MARVEHARSLGSRTHRRGLHLILEQSFYDPGVLVSRSLLGALRLGSCCAVRTLKDSLVSWGARVLWNEGGGLVLSQHVDHGVLCARRRTTVLATHSRVCASL